jgi:hypothetical protein
MKVISSGNIETEFIQRLVLSTQEDPRKNFETEYSHKHDG